MKRTILLVGLLLIPVPTLAGSGTKKPTNLTSTPADSSIPTATMSKIKIDSSKPNIKVLGNDQLVIVSKQKEDKFADYFKEALPLCAEYEMPNSMARPPGFDINVHLRDIAKKLRDKSPYFNSKEGQVFLEYILKRPSEDLSDDCAKLLLNPPT